MVAVNAGIFLAGEPVRVHQAASLSMLPLNLIALIVSQVSSLPAGISGLTTKANRHLCGHSLTRRLI